MYYLVLCRSKFDKLWFQRILVNQQEKTGILINEGLIQENVYRNYTPRKLTICRKAQNVVSRKHHFKKQ